MSLRIEAVSKKYKRANKEFEILRNIDLTVNDGEFVCILGPSGCGKSTLLNIIAGFEKVTEGKVLLDGKEVNSPGPDRAVVFQEHALFPWLKVIDNVEFGMKVAGIPKSERRERALKYLEMMHLTKFKDSFVHELSGGMKQRVSIARALCLDSNILLMDEPFSSLDSQTRELLQLEVQRIWWNTKKTVVFITHSIEEAVLLADRIILMPASLDSEKKEFRIQLSRPRQIANMDVTYMVSKIMKEFKKEVEKVAKSEYDEGWNLEKDSILYDDSSSVGIGL
ncbi:ABC transporter ATP-binding protein [Clostridium sp. CX1]|uniref:ABC transporter ATP-binding protein n=1 Tax=Clostridium tanneri TaxID=3037988 RepID=A0ABU4JUR0_9CLOT|nr:MULTISPECIES: ABC transporter ATP-binding protein [unclassified Clostridium]MCT8976665.1 ABC transporter ATP-binding protein [Clostridium sp. CX1]MDW8801877.1 ABC transporter ATP-binding protein [Clostridium sp. A1-XYC3]